jgi:hypothetical protein
MVWEDSQGNEYDKNVSFGIVLEEEPLLVPNIEDSEVVMRGSKGRVVISISNVGVEEVKFVTLTLLEGEGYEIISSPNVYLGNIDSDDFENAQYDMYASSKEDFLPLKATLNYKDALNNPYTQNITLALPLYSASQAKRFGLLQGGNPLASYISFVVVILTTIFGAVVYYFLVKRKG